MPYLEAIEGGGSPGRTMHLHRAPELVVKRMDGRRKEFRNFLDGEDIGADCTNTLDHSWPTLCPAISGGRRCGGASEIVRYQRCGESYRYIKPRHDPSGCLRLGLHTSTLQLPLD